MINKKNSRFDRAGMYCTRGRMLHSEIVIKMSCSLLAKGSCPYCNCTDSKKIIYEKKTNDNVKFIKSSSSSKQIKHGMTHRITYAIHGEEPYNTVFCKISKKYKHKYSFISVPLKPEHIENVRLFLHDQLGKPFNKWGFRLNFLPFNYFNIGSNKCGGDSSTWFCSELCTAALQQANLLPNIIPCKTSTNDLYYILLHEFNYTLQHSIRVSV